MLQNKQCFEELTNLMAKAMTAVKYSRKSYQVHYCVILLAVHFLGNVITFFRFDNSSHTFNSVKSLNLAYGIRQ
jgi:hypothetical protein